MIRAINLTKTYPQTSNALHALKNVNLEIKKGLIYGIIGASGAGKSTLLRLLGGLEEPTTGEVLFNNKNINLLSRQEKRLMHQRKGIGLTMIILVGYSAMSGAVGGGGLGGLAITYGYYKFDSTSMFMIVIMIVLMVQVIQKTFDLVSKKIDKR